MKANKLTLSRKDVQDYCLKNRYATMRIFEASDDYVAARCLILNAFSPGFVLACQAIEKILKAFIYLETREELKKGHNPFELKEKLKKTKDYELDKYDTLLCYLYDYYRRRYYEDRRLKRGASSKELYEIDDLWIYLIETLPMPDEVKYRMKFFSDLFDDDSRIYWHSYEWIMQDNKALVLKIAGMEKRYKEVLQHLYSGRE